MEPKGKVIKQVVAIANLLNSCFCFVISFYQKLDNLKFKHLWTHSVAYCRKDISSVLLLFVKYFVTWSMKVKTFSY